MESEVLEAFPSGMFRVGPDNTHELIAYTAWLCGASLTRKREALLLYRFLLLRPAEPGRCCTIMPCAPRSTRRLWSRLTGSGIWPCSPAISM